MAVNATAVWRVRTGGNDANGAGYDSAIASAGTDYAQQDSPQLSLTDLVCLESDSATRVKIGSSTGGFTAAMIGNALRISAGTGWVTGYYFITAVDSTNLCTVDRSPANAADRTGGTGRVGGAAATPARIANSANAAGDKIVAGNTVWLRGAGNSYPASADYTDAGYVAWVNGDTTDGMVWFRGENGRPRWERTNSVSIYRRTYLAFADIYFAVNGTGGSAIETGECNHFERCAFDTIDTNANGVVITAYGTAFYDCEFFSLRSGTPTTRTGKAMIMGGAALYGLTIDGCTFSRCGGSGILMAQTLSDMSISRSLFALCKEDGIRVGSITGFPRTSSITNCVFDNTDRAIVFLNDTSAIGYTIANNLFANNAKGVVGYSAKADRCFAMCDYNAFYNNTAHRENVSAGANDIVCTSSPYKSSTDYTPNDTLGGGAELRNGGRPKTMPGSTLYNPIGLAAVPPTAAEIAAAVWDDTISPDRSLTA